MRFALDMDNREIARALGRSEGATKVLLHRAIRQLEESMRLAEEPVRERVSGHERDRRLRDAAAPGARPGRPARAAGGAPRARRWRA